MENQRSDYFLRLSDFEPIFGGIRYSKRNWCSETCSYYPHSDEVDSRGTALVIFNMLTFPIGFVDLGIRLVLDATRGSKSKLEAN